MDVRHKFIRSITTGTASEHGSTHFDDVLDEHNTSGDVYAAGATPAHSTVGCSTPWDIASTSSASLRRASL